MCSLMANSAQGGPCWAPAPRAQPHGSLREGQCVGPRQIAACGSYFFFSLRSFSAWVPSLAGTMGSCRLSSESVSRTGREEAGVSAGPLPLLPWPGGAGVAEQKQQEAPQHRLAHVGLMGPHIIPGASSQGLCIQAVREWDWVSHSHPRWCPLGSLSPGHDLQPAGPKLSHPRTLDRTYHFPSPS